MDEACKIAMGEAKLAMEKYPELEKIVFVTFSDGALAIYQRQFREIFQ